MISHDDLHVDINESGRVTSSKLSSLDLRLLRIRVNTTHPFIIF
jgi:hypothetical protein